MVTYQEAKEIALNASRRVNACREYKAGYHFFQKGADDDGDNGVVVLKDTGRALSFVQFILAKHPEKNPAEVDF